MPAFNTMNQNFAGLDLLPTAVLIVNKKQLLVYLNPAAEDMLDISANVLQNQPLHSLITNTEDLRAICEPLWNGEINETRQALVLERINRPPLSVYGIATLVECEAPLILIELRQNLGQSRLERDERLSHQYQANRELIRNLAHEIKNPLGGIRGAAQLLELELPEKALKEFKEYTQVIIRESERLQTLVDRLLGPAKRSKIRELLNIHEISERVRRLILSEFPEGLLIKRDYDVSIPEFLGDKEQLIQVVLNIAKNAAIALKNQIARGEAKITFKTRVARQITIAKVRHRLSLVFSIIDNGPGVPSDMLERIFDPLVSGHEGGNGLGLTLAQTYVQQHQGIIECDSWEGHTEFIIRIPITNM